MDAPDINKSQSLEERLVAELLLERRRDRRWRIIRFCLLFGSVVSVFALGFLSSGNREASGDVPGEPYAALVRMQGLIALDQGISAAKFNPVLADAFADKQSAGVVLVINSPGGTPVQASIIHDRLLQLRKKYPDKRLLVVGEDMLTSGAYLIAVAGDAIYVNPATLTGSIGVVARNFGFVELMKKIGVERRTQTSGPRKAQLDPFGPETPADREKLASTLSGIHQQFIAIVKAGRQGKLKGEEAELFSGDFWLGTRALELGLVDGLGSVAYVLERELHVSKVREFKPSEPWWTRLVKSARTEFSVLTDEREPFALLPP